MEGIYKDTHKLIDKILQVGGHVQNLSHEEKQKIIKKLSHRLSSLSFPTVKMRGMCESPVTMKLNGNSVIKCEGLVDLDFLEMSG